MHTRATQHFHRGLLLAMTQEKKRILEKHTEIFLDFFIFFLEGSKLKKGKKIENNHLHGKAPDTSILHQVFLLLFIMFLSIIMIFGVILMPFLT